MGKEPKLTKLHESVLRKAYERPDHKVISGSPRTRSALIVFRYITRTGTNRNGYDIHVLTEAGIERAAAIAKSRRAVKVKVSTKTKAALLDNIVKALTDPEVRTMTFDLPNGWTIRFDRSGPSKLVVQVTKP